MRVRGHRGIIPCVSIGAVGGVPFLLVMGMTLTVLEITILNFTGVSLY